MKLSVTKNDADGSPTTAMLEHGEEVIFWNIALFDRVSYDGQFDIFMEINQYWARMKQEEQDAIFSVYRRIRDTYDCVTETNQLILDLRSLVAELFQYHTFGDMVKWIKFTANVNIPSDLNEVYVDSHETPGTRERTFLREDYIHLVALSIMLRIMIPVWGEYISINRKKIGTTLKELQAFKLMHTAHVMESQAMEHLATYVRNNIPDNKPISAILDAISSEEFVTWALALVVVRRLCVGDVRGTDTNASLIPVIYKFLNAKVKMHDSSFMGRVTEKRTDDSEGGDSEENNISTLEGIKIKYPLSAGDIAIMGFDLRDPIKLANKLLANLDQNKLALCLQSVGALESERIWPVQITLTQLIINPVVPAKGLVRMDRRLFLNGLAVAQAILWDKGYTQLAGLISCVEFNNDAGMDISGGESRSRITRDQMVLLDQYYPYSRIPTGKQRVVRNVNPAVQAIDSILEKLDEREWRMTGPNELIVELTGNKFLNKFFVPHDIKVTLADLAISLASKKFYL